ncbi:hypothetical protein [Carboxylicivirga mesophila]|nr:hypothetical protein [Carboxylicivirga mesophila]
MIIDALHFDQLKPFFFKGFLFGKAFKDACAFVEAGIREKGSDFISELNGSFCGYYFNREKGELIVFNDRLGMADLYLYNNGNRVIIADDYTTVCELADDASVDLLALGEMIKFQTPLFSRTFHPHIRLCDNASLITINTLTKEITESRYWRFTAVPQERSKRSLKSDFVDIYIKAVEQCFNETDRRYVIANSGGLDSRCNIHISKQLGKEFQTYTYGQEQSDACYIAKRIEKKLKLQQQYIKVDDDFLSHYSELHLQNRPMMPINYCWYQSAYKHLEQFDINITGFDANFLEAFTHMDPAGGYNAIKDATEDKQLLYNFNLHSVCSDELFAKLVRQPQQMLSYDSYVAEMKNLNSAEVFDKFDEFEQINRQRRLTKAEPWMNYYGELEARSPIIHNDMVDFSLSLPLSYRLDRILYKEAMADYLGAIGRIRFERMPWGLNEPKGLKRTVLETVWKADHKLYKKYGRALWFKGAHKNIKMWLSNSSNIKFIGDTLKRPNSLFEELFDHQYLQSNYQKLIKTNFLVLCSIVSIKMYMDKLNK